MKRLLCVVGAFVVIGMSTPVLAQGADAGAGNKLAWDQAATSLAVAQAYTYTTYADGATTGVVFVGVVCTGTASPFQCEALFPAFTPGAHSIQVTAKNAAGESVKSVALAFTFVVIPVTPVGLRIK